MSSLSVSAGTPPLGNHRAIALGAKCGNHVTWHGMSRAVTDDVASRLFGSIRSVACGISVLKAIEHDDIVAAVAANASDR